MFYCGSNMSVTLSKSVGDTFSLTMTFVTSLDHCNFGWKAWRTWCGVAVYDPTDQP